MIWCLLGETGDGKTIFLSYLGWKNYLAGTKIYANYHLNFPFEYIESIEDLRDIPLEDGIKKLILLDELWLSGDAFDSQSKQVKLLSQFILTCRKKNSDVIHTNQHESQLVKRVRINTSLFMKGRILLSYHEPTKTFTFETPHPMKQIVPYIMSVKFYDKYMKYLNYEESFDVYPAHLYYNTNEDMKQMKTVNYERLAEKYESFKGSMTALSDCLERLDGLGRKDAQGYARFLMTMKTNEYLKEFKENNIKT